MKKLLVGIAAVAVVLGISSCSSQETPETERTSEGKTWVDDVELSDGSEVECVFYDGFNSGGVSCDFG